MQELIVDWKSGANAILDLLQSGDYSYRQIRDKLNISDGAWKSARVKLLSRGYMQKKPNLLDMRGYVYSSTVGQYQRFIATEMSS